jgi:hypothetical protein
MTFERSDRRTIAELLARYDLEPLLRDVYVEGPSDRTLVEAALATFARGKRVRAYEIDTVDVPLPLLDSRSLPDGNKGRILALADELAARTSRDLRRNAVCLADLDLDGILGRCRGYQLLVYTSGLSLDLVLAEAAVIDKLLSMVLLGFPQHATTLLDNMLPILNERLLHRIAAEEVGIRVEPPKLDKLCAYKGQTIEFRCDEFVKRHLNKGKCAHLAGQFREVVERYRPEVARWPRKFVHIDDFLELLHFCVRRIKPKLVPDYSRFRRFIFGLVEADMVARLPEIQEIAARLEVNNASQ